MRHMTKFSVDLLLGEVEGLTGTPAADSRLSSISGTSATIATTGHIMPYEVVNDVELSPTMAAACLPELALACATAENVKDPEDFDIFSEPSISDMTTHKDLSIPPAFMAVPVWPWHSSHPMHFGFECIAAPLRLLFGCACRVDGSAYATMCGGARHELVGREAPGGQDRRAAAPADEPLRLRRGLSGQRTGSASARSAHTSASQKAQLDAIVLSSDSSALPTAAPLLDEPALSDIALRICPQLAPRHSQSQAHSGALPPAAATGPIAAEDTTEVASAQLAAGLRHGRLVGERASRSEPPARLGLCCRNSPRTFKCDSLQCAQDTASRLLRPGRRLAVHSREVGARSAVEDLAYAATASSSSSACSASGFRPPSRRCTL